LAGNWTKLKIFMLSEKSLTEKDKTNIIVFLLSLKCGMQICKRK
jgi:hypothetical protein